MNSYSPVLSVAIMLLNAPTENESLPTSSLLLQGHINIVNDEPSSARAEHQEMGILCQQS